MTGIGVLCIALSILFGLGLVLAAFGYYLKGKDEGWFEKRR